MTKPMLLAEFTRLPPTTRAIVLDGLSGATDMVAEAGPATHRFLRYQWFAAALAAYGGAARTILIEADGDPVIALPMVSFGPGPARLAAVPGCDWPFRSFPVALAAGQGAYDVLLDRLGQEVNALRIGPVADGDFALTPLLATARAKGWATLDRVVADRDRLDIAAARHGAFWRAAASDPVLADMIEAARLSGDWSAGDKSAIGANKGPAIRDWMLVRPGLPAILGHALRSVWERRGKS